MAVSISLSITQNSQNITNNTSNVTVKVTAKWTNGSNNRLVNAQGVPQAKGSVTINGTSYDFASTFNDSVTTTGSKVVCTKTVNVSHNSDGTKTLSCSASYVTGVSSGTVTSSESKTLTTIARKSTLAVYDGYLYSEQTLTVTRQSSNFTHTITAKCGTASTTIVTKSSSTSIKFTPPLEWAKQNTIGTSVSVTYTITTYNGNTSLGNNTYTKTCHMHAWVKPKCTITVSDSTSHFTTFGAYIKGYSKLTITVTPELAYDSPITSYKTTANGTTYTTASFNTDVLKSSGNLTISATVTDKRGRTSDVAKQTISILDYAPPNISKLNVGRCDEDGAPNDQGKYISVSLEWSISELNNKNSVLSSSLQYKKSSESNYATLSEFTSQSDSLMFEADTGSSYDIKLSVTYKLETSSKTASASTAFTSMHWSASGRGMAIGKVSELDDVLDIGMQIRLMGGILYPTLKPGADLNEMRTPGFYVGENVGTNGYSCGDKSLPLPEESNSTFTLEILSGGTNEGDTRQTLQRLTRCHKTEPAVYERWFYTNTWGDWFGGWIYPTLGSKFTMYGTSETDNKPRYRKDGRIVEIRGIVTPTEEITGSTETHVIFTLPTGYRPNSPIYSICQGSGNCIWNLSVKSNGEVGFSRYRNGNTTTNAAINTWLPFQVTYLV